MPTFTYTKQADYVLDQLFGIARINELKNSLRYLAEDVLGDPSANTDKVNFGSATAAAADAIGTTMTATGANAVLSSITGDKSFPGGIATGGGTDYLKWKILSGTSDGSGLLQLTHGLTASKILGISGYILSSSGTYYTEVETSDTILNSKNWDATYARIKIGYSSFYSRPGKILVFHIP
jgi:hypothetical protein